MPPLNDDLPDDNLDQGNQPESRRDMLLASLEAAETGAPTAEPTTGAPAADRARDDAGRFAPKQQDGAAPEAAPAPAPAGAGTPTPMADGVVQPTAAQKKALTTWKKEFVPLQEKLEAGTPLTLEEAQRLAAYNVEREGQYSTGVSLYKAEAQQAKHLTEAMAEFMPTLQQHGLQPAAWIQNLGRAHHTLALGSPEQKVQMFTRLAQEYNVPLGVIQQAQAGQVDPATMQLMQEIQNLKQNVQGVTSWRQQQEEQAVQQEISKFSDATKYPHFDQVRESMARLLEAGMAQTPDEAYAKAVRLDETVAAQEQQRQAAAQQAASAQARQAAVAKARSASVSVRSATPSGAAGASAPKDRRGALAEAFEAADAGRV